MIPSTLRSPPGVMGGKDSEEVMREIDRFNCKDEAGNVYEVVVWESEISHRRLSDQGSKKGGTRRYSLADGSEVIPIGPEAQSSKILQGDVRIRRVRPI